LPEGSISKSVIDTIDGQVIFYEYALFSLYMEESLSHLISNKSSLFAKERDYCYA
jgi:hypothetical protein